MKPKVKRKQGKKIGVLARISTDAHKFLSDMGTKSIRESLDQALAELFDMKIYIEQMNKGKTWVVLPESRIVCQTMAEARGEAILRAVKRGKRMSAEEPVQVREIL